MELKSYQKMNRFPAMNEICRKDFLARNLNRMLKQYPEDYNIFPKTWCLPSEYCDFVDYCRGKKSKLFICKPNSKGEGRGIFLTGNIRDVGLREDMICQVYIPKPFILDGYKFDLRLYVLITCCDPLRVYLYNEGLIRFATSKYTEPTEKNLDDVYMHLTNYSINKNSKNFVQDENKGSKRKLSFFNQYMESNAYDLERLWISIEDVVIKTILSAYPALKQNYISHFPKHVSGSFCFQILGFDILLDHTLKPWLLEVNQSPSLSTESKLDEEVKDSLIYDTLCMVNLIACDQRKVMKEEWQRMKRRLFNIQRSQECRAEKKRNNQAAWVEEMKAHEDKNMGNFRRIYPSATSDRYAKFLNCKSLLFRETVSSKARDEYARLMRKEFQEREEQKKMSLKSWKVPEKNRRKESPLQKSSTRLILVKPRSPEELQTSPSSTPTSQVLEVVSSPSQDAGSGKKNVGHSCELSPGRADVEPERVSVQNARGSEHCPQIPNQTPAEQEKPDQRQQQTEVPLEIAAEVQDGTAGSEAENQPDANIQELEAEPEAHSGAQAVEEESQSLPTSSETVSQTLSVSIDEVNQEDLQFQPESCHQSQAKAGVQAQAEVQEQSLREAEDQGQLPAQGLIRKEFQEQLLQELHDHPETEEGACDQADEEVCECGQVEAQYQDREEDTQLEILYLVENNMIVEESQLEDTLRAENSEPSGTSREFHPEVQSQPRSQGSPEAPTFRQGEEKITTRETPSTAASQVIKKLSKALKTKCNKVGPEDDKTYPRRTDVAERGNITEVFSNEVRDQRESCCSCWDYTYTPDRICCVEPGCRNPSEHQQDQGTEMFPSVSAHPERVTEDKSRGKMCMSSKPPTSLHRGLTQSTKPRTGQRDLNSNGRNTAKCCRPCCLV